MHRIRVWDVPQRFFHWALAGLVFFNWLAADDKGLAYILHTSAGYLVFLLVLYRIVWGAVGSTHARFGDFVYGPGAVLRYVGGLMRLRPKRHIGHNPLGGWAVLLLLGLTLAVAITGMLGAAREPGALLEGVIDRTRSRELRHLHETLANLLVILAFVHVAAVLLDWVLTRDNLVRAMIVGTKTVSPEEKAEPARGGGIWLGLAVAVPFAVLGAVMFANTTF